jgi:hypothetical protein
VQEKRNVHADVTWAWWVGKGDEFDCSGYQSIGEVPLADAPVRARQGNDPGRGASCRLRLVGASARETTMRTPPAGLGRVVSSLRIITARPRGAPRHRIVDAYVLHPHGRHTDLWSAAQTRRMMGHDPLPCDCASSRKECTGTQPQGQAAGPRRPRHLRSSI